MSNFNVNNSDFYYTGATGSFNNYCNNTFRKPTSYLYVEGHDDEYIENNDTWISFPWPYLNTGLLPVRPPTPIFSGSGECIGCPKVASAPQYLNHRNFNSLYVSNNWESIYPSGQNFPFLETGLSVSWFQELVPLNDRVTTNFLVDWFDYMGPELKILEPTADVTPYWDTNGAKIHIKYSIKGNNYVRLVIGFVAKIVNTEDIEYDMYYDTDITSINVDEYAYNYFSSLYYKYPGLNTDFSFEYEQPVFIFDSCAVKNIDNELNAYGPAPGFHPYDQSVFLNSSNLRSIYIKYFAFTKKEGSDPIDPFQKVEASIGVAGFGWPNGLAGLYSKPNDIPLEEKETILATTVDSITFYKLNWGRGINFVTGIIENANQSICLYKPYDNLGYAGRLEPQSSFMEPEPIVSTRVARIKNMNPLGSFLPNLGRRDGYITAGAFGYIFDDALSVYTEIPPPPFEALTDFPPPYDKYFFNNDRKGLPNTDIPILPPKPYFVADCNVYEGNEVDIGTYGFIPGSSLNILEQEFDIKSDNLLDYIDNIETDTLLSESSNTKNDLVSTLTNPGVLFGGYHVHPLFYIGGEQIFATEPIYKNVYVNVSGYIGYFTTISGNGGFIHPYRKMIEFLDNFGIPNSFETQVSIDNCTPKYIVTTPISNPINYFSGYITENLGSAIATITGDNIINIKALGDDQFNMYNIVDSNKKINLNIISDTGLFSEDIEYVYVANPNNLQGSPSKIICNNNIVYNLAPFFGYYQYNILNGCTTYNTSFNSNPYGDGGYSDLIVTNNKIYLLNEFHNNVYVINKFNNTLFNTISGLETPKSMFLDELNNRLYVTSLQDSTIKIFNDNYKLTGTINLLAREYGSKIKIIDNKLYALTNAGLVIISGANQITGVYNAYSDTSGYQRISGIRGYDILNIGNNDIYIGTDLGIKILDANTNIFSSTPITGFTSNLVIPDPLKSYLIRADSLAYHQNNNKIYSIDRSTPYVFVLDTGLKKCDKIISLPYIIGGLNTITFDNLSNKMYISTTDRVFDYGKSNNFIILGNRPKAQINFPPTPQLINQNTYRLNVTSNNNQTGFLYKSNQFPFILINNSGEVILPTGNGVNNFEFKIFAGQKATSNFAYSFASQNCKIGSTGTNSVLYYNNLP